jgi:hypothetical protein
MVSLEVGACFGTLCSGKVVATDYPYFFLEAAFLICIPQLPYRPNVT